MRKSTNTWRFVIIPGGLLAAAILVLAFVIPAFAQSQAHDLYVNRDGKAFVLERTFTTLAECDRAARIMFEAKQALGAGCKPSRPLPAAATRPNPDAEFGSRFIEAQRQEREQAIQDAARQEQARREAESRALEDRKVRALEQANSIEERKARALEDLRWRR